MNRWLPVLCVVVAVGGLALLFVDGGLGLFDDAGPGPSGYEVSDEDGALLEVGEPSLEGTGEGTTTTPPETEGPSSPISTFVMAEGLHGTVTDGRGDPVAGASVGVAPRPRRFREWAPPPEPVARATTDAQGVFRISPVPANGPLILRAQASGFAPSKVVVPRRGIRTDLVLDRGGALAIRVVDDQSRPVVGAQVMHAVGWQWRSVVSHAITGAEGQVRFHSVPTGTGTLAVAAPGHASARLHDVAAAPGETVTRTVVLGAPKEVRGKVVDSAKQPVSGARVQVHYPALTMLEPGAPATTDGDGTFQVQVDAAPGERIEYRVVHSDYAEARVQRNLQKQEQDLTFTLQARGEGIRGLVRSNLGLPVSDAQVTYLRLQDDEVPETRTDAEGAFVLPRPAHAINGVELLVLSPTQGLAVRYVRLTSKAGQEQAPVEIRLTGAGRVSGQVTSGVGQPVAGALVELQVDGQASQRILGPRSNPSQVMRALHASPNVDLATATDNEGYYVIENVPPLAYRVMARHGLQEARTEEAIVVDAEGLSTADVQLGEGRTIEGWVTDGDDRPVAGAHVSAAPQDQRGRGWGIRQPSARTQADGRFVLRGVGDYEYTVRVNASGHQGRAEKNVAAGTRDLTLVLTRLGWIEGVVHDERGPYQGTFQIHVRTAGEQPGNRLGSSNRGWFGNNVHTFNTDDGHFVVRGQSAGEYLVRASTGDGKIGLQQERVRVVDGQGSAEVRLRLSAGAVLRGRLTRARDGTPIARAWVNVHARPGTGEASTSGATSGGTRTDGQGNYEIRGLGTGAFSVRVFPPQGVQFTAQVDLQIGRTTTLDLTQHEPGRIRIRVVTPDGTPIDKATPKLTSASGIVVHPNWQLLRSDGLLGDGVSWQDLNQTDDRGENLRHHVPPGRYQVSAAKAGYALQGDAPWVEVASNGETSIDVILAPEGPSDG